MDDLKTLHWVGGVDGHLRLIDQTLLPVEFKEIDCRTVEAVWEAIKTLRVRGAPAIGIAAAYGVCVGMQTVAAEGRTTFQVVPKDGPVENRPYDEHEDDLFKSSPKVGELTKLALLPSPPRSDRLSGQQPADGRQPVLGA